ncbi:hypothetical protein C7H19_20900 [Aphanothece hegewaldii CCALA 016]|uniref:Uncharacterized protein n=1 Tax=Aphanothece hegewaldii CCALA 016 TaxID=2107694 RepID=A0A2T1LSX3_9CHRO|nr:hypothetical protein [Aphanothece hegewaldii]PSF33060.1 hypothetical protein C7H19_20900 [Aphanothece hegewaldii CCALA 016]
MVKNLRRVSYSLIGFLGLLGVNLTVSALPTTSTCPTDTEKLSQLLLQDLPSYANRVLHRSKKTDLGSFVQTYVIVSGQGETQPLPLRQSPSQYQAIFSEVKPQVFFTTFERQYSNNKLVRFHNYNWLFLVPTEKGWRLVMSLSQLASLEPTQPNDPPLPPIDTTNGVIGQAVQLWLRDCEAGVLKTGANLEK